ncbi:hypothetical protein BGZ46_001571 [Entomortierella lignicola]|nr:hypothetical protein BGZ46_001571 [Entomortierella lignicola]
MCTSIIKLASAVMAFTCVIQAVPLSRRFEGQECNLSVSSDNVSLGSTMNIVPVTQVTPVTQYQPIIQLYAPLFESLDTSSRNVPFWGNEGVVYFRQLPISRDMRLGDERFARTVDRVERLNRFGFLERIEDLHPSFVSIGERRIVNRFDRRDATFEDDQSNGNVRQKCVSSETQTCEETVPSSTTDLGSIVTVAPSDQVLPSTVYQGHIQSNAAKIYAAETRHTNLRQSNVNLGSNTFIQPVTKVIPSTIYQPSVHQKTTVIEADEPEYQSLPRSSVSLGSTVTIRPVTTVEPLTIYQPRIESLPFIIDDETGCQD